MLFVFGGQCEAKEMGELLIDISVGVVVMRSSCLQNRHAEFARRLDKLE